MNRNQYYVSIYGNFSYFCNGIVKKSTRLPKIEIQRANTKREAYFSNKLKDDRATRIQKVK